MKLRSAKYSVDIRIQFEPDEWGAYAINSVMIYDVRNKSVSEAVEERIDQLMHTAPTEIVEITVIVQVYE